MINTPNSFKSMHVAEEIINNFIKNFEMELNYSINVYSDKNVENGILNYAKHTKCRLNRDIHSRKNRTSTLLQRKHQRRLDKYNRPDQLLLLKSNRKQPSIKNSFDQIDQRVFLPKNLKFS